MLYFNRVAKTGSQSFTHLLIKQGEKLGFNVWPKIVQSESLVDTPEGLADEIASVVKAERPTVFVRHYSFIDFDRGYHLCIEHASFMTFLKMFETC